FRVGALTVSFISGGSPDRPRKASAWSGNQQPRLTEPKEKTAPNRNCQLTCNGVKLFPLI
ncbi:hypothetical protein J7E63_28015, partial [Bacillus sp. ISL-75]|uniref:hypothetical protein n=1 Tax=Bacillus sp. ISL-75 TaxID=2819137 RepID=UPI001BE9C562